MRSKMFSERCARGKRLHGHVGVGKNLAHGLGHGSGQLAGALESHGARESHGEIGEIAVPGPADADAIDFENAVDAQNRVVDLGSHSRRRSIEQSIDGAAGQAPTHRNDNAGHESAATGSESRSQST